MQPRRGQCPAAPVNHGAKDFRVGLRANIRNKCFPLLDNPWRSVEKMGVTTLHHHPGSEIPPRNTVYPLHWA